MGTGWHVLLWSVRLLLCSSLSLCYCIEVTTVHFDSKNVCLPNRNTPIWVTEQRCLIVVGLGAADQGFFKNCSIVVGASLIQPRFLRIDFEAFHIIDCNVWFSVNQSSNSDFTSDNSEMIKTTCGHGVMPILYSQEKYFIKISLHKANMDHTGYNFRLNITVTDKMPQHGLETHVVIIVAVVVVVMLCSALCLLIKYLHHRSQQWREQRAERTMERAINLYNSQEVTPESDYMYTALPHHVITSAVPNGNGHRRPIPGARSNSRHHGGEITFVHADGHIETFRTRDEHIPQNRPSCSTAVGVLERNAELGIERGAIGVEYDSILEENGHVVVDSGDLPPSYEEALQMPNPQGLQSPLYANILDKT